MTREIELKFALAPGDERRLRAAAALAGVPPARKRFLAIYFDTPAGDLARARMALRLRREGRRWFQTLKTEGAGAGGLHERPEWEFPRPAASLDLSLFMGTPIATLDDAARLHERLVEVFRIDSTRTAWVLEPAPGTRVEVALDRGEILANGRSEAVSEVEIESLEGDVAAIFDIAEQLLGEVPLRAATLSKAERGAGLRLRLRPKPVKAPEIHLEAGATIDEAARGVVGAGVAQLQANEEGLLAASDPEFVHQARVAIRRTRSALRIFRDVIGAERAQAWRDALGETARALGAARDWDVFGIEVLPEVLEAFGDGKIEKGLRARVARRRRAEREAARTALRASAHAQALLGIARWMALPEIALSPEPLVDFASDLIRKRHKRLVADAAHFAQLTAEERHRLRIDVKRLRYSVDALESVFPPRRVERYLEILVELQDALGHANDAVTAAGLMPQLDPPAEFAAFARGWFAARAAGDRGHLDALLEGLAATPRFWRRKRMDPATEA